MSAVPHITSTWAYVNPEEKKKILHRGCSGYEEVASPKNLSLWTLIIPSNVSWDPKRFCNFFECLNITENYFPWAFWGVNYHIWEKKSSATFP